MVDGLAADVWKHAVPPSRAPRSAFGSDLTDFVSAMLAPAPELQAAFLKCLASGIENPDSGMGCYACQPADYDRFKPFFSKALAKYHKVAEDAKHVNNWSLEGVEGLPADGAAFHRQLHQAHVQQTYHGPSK